MKYKELTACLQGDGFAPSFIHDLLKDLGYPRPMDMEYTEADYRRILEEAFIRRDKARNWQYKGEYKGEKSEVRLIPSLAQDGLWFRAAPYRIRDGFIEPSSKAKEEEYPLKPEILDRVVPDLVKLGMNVQLVQKGKEIHIGPESIEAFLNFYNTYGPLGLDFRDVWAIWHKPLEGRVVVNLHPTLPLRKDLRKHFKNCEYDKFAYWTPVKGTEGKNEILWFKFDRQSFLRHYREPEFAAAQEAMHFSFCARQIMQGDLEDLPPGRIKERIDDYSYLILQGDLPNPVALVIFTLIERAFLHSRPHISYVGGRSKLKLSWRPNSLLDAAYLHLFKLILEGEYRICKDPKCGRLFKFVRGRGRPRKYCSNRCQARHGMEEWRARAKGSPPPGGGAQKGGGRPKP